MKKYRLFLFFSTLFLAVIAILFFVRWKSPYAPLKGESFIYFNNSQATGEELAKAYCQMCHLYPEPSLLDKKTWNDKVLPDMGKRLGIRPNGIDPYKGLDSMIAKEAKEFNIYPETPLITETDWNKIVNFYIENAPKELPPIKKTVESVDSKFTPSYITIGDKKLPLVTLLKWNENTSELYIGDATDLYVLKNNKTLTARYKLNSPASHIEFDDELSTLLLTIGLVMPNDRFLGKLNVLDPVKKDHVINLEKLKRPVHVAVSDLNKDGKKDAVISNFGHRDGSLSWYDGFDNSKEHVLKNLPGTRKAEIKDMNGDNKPDVIAMMTQAYEQIIIFYNLGDGKFEEKPVLSFNPAHGLSYFETVDFNNDGHLDLLVSNGDNRDLSVIDKPYHGVRIYLNDGLNNFEEAYFYPMYDCNKVMARDFDNDGDLDIVASAFWSQYTENRNLKESFVYLNNTGNLNFIPSYLPGVAHGKWLTMDVGDFNNDNLLDVMLGAAIFTTNETIQVLTATGISDFPQVLILTQTK
ncbi:FG-GAP repeat domain-containing protein [Aureibaculum conchae]|uniref:FG-GAP repeat domain-containing protein n=1 Tax=Aureibaculum sp. 2308TA14-22 TaxID=3108392 RepID=UPI0033940E39